MMKKLTTLLMALVCLLPLYAGEKTITISRNDVDWESANTVYNISKGGVQLVMSGGMNNPNFLLMKQQTTITIKSANFNIKRIVFHCLDNYPNSNIDVFYWGPTTLSIQYSQTHSETAGTLTYNYGGSSYDALWVSTKNSTPGNYPDGLPAGYELMFKNQGKPVRFASIDIVLEQENGDMYELVTSQSEIKTDSTYILVGRQYSTSTTGRALSVEETANTPSGNPTRKSTPVELLENGRLVKATGNVQLIKLEATGNSTRPYYLKMGSNYLRRRSGGIDGSGNNIGSNLYGVSSLSNYESDLANYFRTSITINGSATYYNALIRFGHLSSETAAPSGGVTRTFAIRHSNANGYFRDLDYSSNNGDAQYQRVYLYKPAWKYKVTTEVQPEAPQGESPYGSISLRDGILVEYINNEAINWSQKMDTVQFLVTPANGYKISNVSIQARDGNNTVVETVNPLRVSQSINGTLYTFVMPGFNAHIIATFAPVEYHNIYTVVKPTSLCGNIFLTEGYVVQQDQVKSYEGENVVFNVTPNLIDIQNENGGYFELSYVTVKDHATGVETTLAADQLGNYNFTMPDNEVTITAYFFDNTKAPLYLLGDANGGKWTYQENGTTKWHTYGPRFNYNDDTDEYYLDVYFKGTGSYGDNSGENFGRFSVTWKIDLNDNWSNINGGNWRGVPGENDYLVNETNTAQNAIYLWYGSDYENNAYKIPAGIYRIYVGTTASANKGNLASNQLKIEKYPITLTLDPMGGATAADAVEVSQNQLVTLSGDLYSRIKAINPDEADGNFMYKATQTISGTATSQSESATTATSTISRLTQVNDGETVTQLDGTNYLGWIHADQTAYYKVISTPLHWIEKDGEVDKTYTVADQLQGIYRIGTSLWCKDLGDQSIIKTSPLADQTDFMGARDYTPAGARKGNWDQSNWVELDFSDYPDGSDMAQAGLNKLIDAGTVTGVLTDKLNYKMRVTSGALQTGDDATYQPNTYCTVNFLPENLTLDGQLPTAAAAQPFYFLNPKIQEYAVVTWAMWDQNEDQQMFVVSARDGAENFENFNGAFNIGGWTYNVSPGDEVIEALNHSDNTANVYEFHIIVRRTSDSYGAPIIPVAAGAPRHAAIKPGQTASVIEAWPIDLVADFEGHLVTAVRDLKQSAQVQRVEYVNVAGMRSSKPFDGLNIVVTHYTDGTTATTKSINR